MASLPFIKTLSAMVSSFFLLFHGDDAVRAHGGAEGAADTVLLFGHHRRGVAFFVDLVLGNGQNVLGTGVYAKAAALTQICQKRDFCHLFCSFLAASGGRGNCFLNRPGLPRPDGGLLFAHAKSKQKRAKTCGFGFP